LLLCDAIAHADHNANFVSPWWPKLSQWAEYLEKYGLDPEEQLCTDDFMGHLVHNANLSIKAILGLNIFPPTLAQEEIAQYRQVVEALGVPVDSRTKVTKTDWSIWSATLASDPADFQALISPIYDYVNQTSTRDPVADSYDTSNVHSGGMHARPVVGGFFIKMLADRSLWRKWSARDTLQPANWAPHPSQNPN
jgi:hypothetical protein